MAGSRTLKIEILGDAKGVAGAFGSAEKSADGFGTKIGGVAKVAGAAFLGIGAAAVAFGPKIFAGGVELEAMGRKAETVFSGGSLAQVQTWADGVAGSMGLTSTQAVGLATNVADLLKPMGFTAEAAAGMSTDMINLSGALSAWTGGTMSAGEVSETLTKALLGETDGLKALGISISAADVSARLAAKGQGDLTGAALEQAEALAIQELIMEKSTDAQTAWADGSMDSVKAQNKAKASMAKLTEGFTKALYPALAAIVPVITDVAEWAGENLPKAFKAAKDVIGTVVGSLAAFGSWILDHKPVLASLTALIGGGLVLALGLWATATWAQVTALWAQAVAFAAAHAPVLLTIAAIAALTAAVVYAYENWDFFRDTVDAVASFFKKTVWPLLQTLFEWMQDNIPPILVGIGAAFTAAFGVAKAAYDNVLKPMFNAAVSLIQGSWTTLSPIVSGIGSAISLAFSVAKAAYDTVLAPLFGAIASMVGVAWSAAKPTVDAIGAGISVTFGVAKFAYDNVLKPIFTGIAAVVTTAALVINPIISAIGSGVSTAFGVAKTAYDTVLKPIFTGIGAVIQAGWDIAKPIVSTMGSVISGVLSGISTVIETAVGWIQALIDKLIWAWEQAYSVYLKASTVFGSTMTGGGIAAGVAKALKPKVPINAFATGTMSAPGGMSIVGELGPELVNLPSGSQVFPADLSASMMSGNRAMIVINVGGSVVAERDLTQAVYEQLLRLGQRSGGLVLA